MTFLPKQQCIVHLSPKIRSMYAISLRVEKIAKLKTKTMFLLKRKKGNRQRKRERKRKRESRIYLAQLLTLVVSFRTHKRFEKTHELPFAFI